MAPSSATPRASAVMRAVVSDLRETIRGEVRDDRLARALYATDASIYEIVPDAAVLPRSAEDVQAVVRICRRHGVPVTARGAGTGLAGGCVNRGVQLDCSRHLRSIRHIDPASRIAVVEPGVVLDDLNAAARRHGLHFAPDVATSSRATIGGMIANNSCGAHSVRYGRTVDHVLAVDVVLSDGSRQTWGAVEGPDLSLGPAFSVHESDFGRQCERALGTIVREFAADIAARYPRIMRQSGGYALNRLRADGDHANAETIICGSEGTLAVVVGAVLKLTPLPACKGLVVAHFHDLLDALAATPTALEHRPAAVELLDKLILDAARANPAMRRRPWRVEGDPRGLLIIELFEDDAASLAARLRDVADALRSRRQGYAWPILTGDADQEDLWHIRRSGLGLLMSRPGDRQTYDFVEDTAVDPARLRDYIERFMQVLDEEGVTEASYYAHASVGCLHVKPVLNLKKAGDVERMHRIADRISSLALEFGGTMTGEHGDGILRSGWLEKMYGPRIVEAFRRVKSAFDPHGLFNPGKIVDPLPMTENFRYGAGYRTQSPPTVLDFSSHGGMAGLAEMCSGVGECRRTGVGTMCPSYVASLDETHTTRARANALRLALSNRALIDGLADPALDEVMDLCVSCKACKTECPTGVDMARLKAEWQYQRHRAHGAPRRSRLIAHAAELACWGCRMAPVANAIAKADWFRELLDHFLGIDRRMPLPAFAPVSFETWYRRSRTATHRGERPRSGADVPAASGARERPRVAYFVDTWTNYFTPAVGIAAVSVLEALGYQVIVPSVVCCGRPAISRGLLDHARALAGRNCERLTRIASQGIPIVGTEPSCILTFVDEFPQLVRSPEARRVAERCMTIETFLAGEIQARRLTLPSPISHSPSSSPIPYPLPPFPQILYHAHCHQKAIIGTDDARIVLQTFFNSSAGTELACGGDAAAVIDSGCCGMAGSFGHEKEHYDVARAIGEDRLFPAVRNRGERRIAVSGFSCRCQIEHHTDARPRHLIEYVAERLGVVLTSSERV